MNRKYSLKKNIDIANLKNLKQSVGNKFYAIYFKKNEKILPRIALSVSKRYGVAVKRNYEKRVTREILRNELCNLKGLSLLVIIKTETNSLSFSEKKEQIKYLIKKINKIIGEKYDK